MKLSGQCKSCKQSLQIDANGFRDQVIRSISSPLTYSCPGGHLVIDGNLYDDYIWDLSGVPERSQNSELRSLRPISSREFERWQAYDLTVWPIEGTEDQKRSFYWLNNIELRSMLPNITNEEFKKVHKPYAGGKWKDHAFNYEWKYRSSEEAPMKKLASEPLYLMMDKANERDIIVSKNLKFKYFDNPNDEELAKTISNWDLWPSVHYEGSKAIVNQESLNKWRNRWKEVGPFKSMEDLISYWAPLGRNALTFNSGTDDWPVYGKEYSDIDLQEFKQEVENLSTKKASEEAPMKKQSEEIVPIEFSVLKTRPHETEVAEGISIAEVSNAPEASKQAVDLYNNLKKSYNDIESLKLNLKKARAEVKIKEESELEPLLSRALQELNQIEARAMKIGERVLVVRDAYRSQEKTLQYKDLIIQSMLKQLGEQGQELLQKATIEASNVIKPVHSFRMRDIPYISPKESNLRKNADMKESVEKILQYVSQYSDLLSVMSNQLKDVETGLALA